MVVAGVAVHVGDLHLRRDETLLPETQSGRMARTGDVLLVLRRLAIPLPQRFTTETLFISIGKQ